MVNQETAAQSSHEAEYLANGSGARDNMYVQSLAKEIGFKKADGSPLSRRIFTDSSNSKSTCHRTGPSKKLRHIDVRHHFIQDLVRTRRLAVEKIDGQKNPADLGTKIHAAPELRKLKEKVAVGSYKSMEGLGPLCGDTRRAIG